MSDISNVLERHKSFWNMGDVGKPLLRVYRYNRIPGQRPSAMRLPLADGTMASEDVFYLKPEMLKPERFSPRDENPSETPRILDDIFSVRSPYVKVPWMEAILGCPIKVSLQSSSMWSEPALGADWFDKFKPLKVNHAWREKLLEFIDYLSANSGLYLVAHTLMRGPSDMVDALIGEENLCTGIYEHPDEIHELMMLCADVFVDTANAQLDRIPSFQRGYCNPFGIWAPGKSIRTQDDASALVSPDDYREFMLPPQEYIASRFDYSTIHLHSNSLHTVDAVIDSSINAIQVSIDAPPYGPTIVELLPTFAKINENKPILIEGPMTQLEFDKLLENLSPRGLYIRANIESETDDTSIA